MKDIETIFIVVFVLIDNQYKRIVNNYSRLRASGPEPEFSDSEVIALALMAELATNNSENAWIPYVTKNYKYLFPKIIERSRYNRRVKDLTQIIDEIRCNFRDELAGEMPLIQIIDSVPLPVCHYGRRRKMPLFFREKLLLVCVKARKRKYMGSRYILQHHLEGFLYRSQ